MVVAELLARVDVLNTEGLPEPLGSYWKTQTTVLTFVRHFG